MKKIFLCLVCACGGIMTACVDSTYDLSKLQTDNIAIGDASSVTKMPLVTVQVSMSEIVNDQTNILALCAKAEKWLPAVLPEGLDYLDLSRINDADYNGTLFDNLVAEMNSNPGKLDEITTLIVEDYASDFAEVLGVPASRPDLLEKAFRYAYESPEVLSELRRHFTEYFATDLQVEPLHYEINGIDIGSDVVDMLVDNLDPEGTPNPTNTLNLAGEIVCKLPISMKARPAFSSGWDDIVAFDIDVDATREVNEIAESIDTRVYAEGLRRLVNGAEITIPVTFERYYPGNSEFLNTPADDESAQIEMTLHIIKRGGIKFNI